VESIIRAIVWRNHICLITPSDISFSSVDRDWFTSVSEWVSP
jgi:hypothetical protein